MPRGHSAIRRLPDRVLSHEAERSAE
ncbi:hypothetical protein SEA_IHOP_132 [Mycobacterium phage IHOP]|uniref:Uncharacterized protein n=2 Tax=Kostyavirus toto TaxID=1993871 RepID=A0A345KXD8_9CAUD|nr:hypothetical protein SEA_IHOP_132 [Mycobacterium phage IHOP]AXH48327.1 hypothetical protein SEA_PHAJA_132 [Mycobacterium phage Phaja]AXH48775.1 hypothetical protein SEA_SHEREKHAN_127 [Mycobacterium phage ShereKhan]